eukprot:TRINITY_DN2594_c0_g1_i1.p1 TRINITY_DN2594_c0_g1~~TRINITY_DN2594_c0_g1_i1.p1  ORF type:complete len:301 (+),score=70.25 TRINITY_DN2594_c0_g1_i1:300-1202(+)
MEEEILSNNNEETTSGDSPTNEAEVDELYNYNDAQQPSNYDEQPSSIEIYSEHEQLDNSLSSSSSVHQTEASPIPSNDTGSITEELEQAKQEIDYLNSLVNQLSAKERRATEELVASKDMIRQALMRNALLQRSFNLRIMGLLDPEVLKRAGVNDLEAADLMTLLQTSWHPMKTDFSDINNPKRVLNVNDEALQAIKACYGEEVAKDLVRAFNEIEEYNAAGRYPVVMPWSSQHERPMTLPEQIQTLMQLIKGLEAAHQKILSVFGWIKPMLVPVVSVFVVYLIRTATPHVKSLYRTLRG